MKHLFKTLLLSAIILLIFTESRAQVDSLIIHLNDGSIERIAFKDIEKANFNPINTGNFSILLNNGWNLISSNIKPQLPDSMQNAWSEISDNLLIAKNNGGQVYIPSYDINSIGRWNVTQGYLVYMSAADTLSIFGSDLVPSETPISLGPGWNTIAYLRNSELSAELSFASITDNNNLLIAKTLDGLVYIPSFDINTIGNLKQGVGYKVYVTTADTLVYPGN